MTLLKFEEYFKNELFETLIIEGNLKSTKIIASRWNKKSKWVENLKLQQTEANNHLKECKKKLAIYFTEIKTKFNTLFPTIGIQLIQESGEREIDKGRRTLNALSRILIYNFPKETCVAACVDPLYHNKILIASNQRGLVQEAVITVLNKIVQMNLEILSQEMQLEESINLKTAYSQRSGMRSDIFKPIYDHRIFRDIKKYRATLTNIIRNLPIRIVKSPSNNVHAELQLLEYCESAARYTAMRTQPVYIGVSLRCCAKCETLIREYNSCGFNKFNVLTRGWHPTYDLSGWTCPPILVDKVTHKGVTNQFGILTERLSRVGAIKYLTVAEQSMPKYPMTEDLSDDEDGF